jgi:hypothetical protein
MTEVNRVDIRLCGGRVYREAAQHSGLLKRAEREPPARIARGKPPHEPTTERALGIEQNEHHRGAWLKRITTAVSACQRRRPGGKWPLRSHTAYDMLFPARDARLRITPGRRTTGPRTRRW